MTYDPFAVTITRAEYDLLIGLFRVCQEWQRVDFSDGETADMVDEAIVAVRRHIDGLGRDADAAQGGAR